MKVPKNLSREERETFLRTDGASNTWDFYSRDPKFKRLLERRGYPVKEDHQGLWSCELPLKAITIRRTLTSEQREKRSVLAKQHGFQPRKNKPGPEVDLDIGGTVG